MLNVGDDLKERFYATSADVGSDGMSRRALAVDKSMFTTVSASGEVISGNICLVEQKG
jgi:hypothetical protein